MSGWEGSSWIGYAGVTIIGLLVGRLVQSTANKNVQEIKAELEAEAAEEAEGEAKAEAKVKVEVKIEAKVDTKTNQVLFTATLVLNAVLYIMLLHRYGLTMEGMGYGILISGLLLIACIDLKTMYIPDWTHLVLLTAGLVLAFSSQEVDWLERGIGFGVAGFFFLAVVFLSRGGMGGGDVKLMAVAGFCLGWKLILASMFIAFMLGGVIGGGILILGKGKLKTEIPYGPILVAGIILAIFCGDEVIRWYLHFIIR